MPDEKNQPPSFYADQFKLWHSPYGAAVLFGISPPPAGVGEVQFEPVVTVRMSLEHAKVLSMLIRKNLKQYELEGLGDEIHLPVGVLSQMGLRREDW